MWFGRLTVAPIIIFEPVLYICIIVSELAIVYEDKEVSIVSLENGSSLRSLPMVNCVVGHWQQLTCKDVTLLSLYGETRVEYGEKAIYHFINGQFPISFSCENGFPREISDFRVSPDLSSIGLLVQGEESRSLQMYQNTLQKDLIKSYLKKIEKSADLKAEIDKWMQVSDSAKKYQTGLNWIRNQIAQSSETKSLKTALKLLFFLDTASAEKSQERLVLEGAVNFRSAYRFRDQLVRCGEDLRKRASIFPLLRSFIETIESNQKVLLSWFLSLYTDHYEASTHSLSKVEASLQLKSIESLISTCEENIACLNEKLKAYNCESSKSISSKLCSSLPLNSDSPHPVLFDFLDNDRIVLVDCKGDELVSKIIDLNHESTRILSSKSITPACPAFKLVISNGSLFLISPKQIQIFELASLDLLHTFDIPDDESSSSDKLRVYDEGSFGQILL